MSSTVVGYLICNITKGMYCGPKFRSKDDKIYCNYSWKETTTAAMLFNKPTAQHFIRSLRNSHPKSQFRLHKISITTRGIKG